MNGYSNLSSSPDAMAEKGNGTGAVPRNSSEGNPWAGVVVGGGVAGLSRNFSSASRRSRATEVRAKTGHGLQAAVRRAFSMRRQPSSLAEGYWRIHDGMDGEEAEEEVKEGGDQQKPQQQEVDASGKKKGEKRSKIMKACRKLLGFL